MGRHPRKFLRVAREVCEADPLAAVIQQFHGRLNHAPEPKEVRGRRRIQLSERFSGFTTHENHEVQVVRQLVTTIGKCTKRDGDRGGFSRKRLLVKDLHGTSKTPSVFRCHRERGEAEVERSIIASKTRPPAAAALCTDATSSVASESLQTGAPAWYISSRKGGAGGRHNRRRSSHLSRGTNVPDLSVQ